MTNETIIKNIEDCVIQRTILYAQLEQLKQKASDFYIEGTYIDNKDIMLLINRTQEIIWELDHKISNYEKKLELDTTVKCKIHNRYIDICEKYL